MVKILANLFLMFTAFLQIPSPDYMIHKHGECTGNQFGSLYYDHFLPRESCRRTVGISHHKSIDGAIA